MVDMDDRVIEQYSRQILLDQIGYDGQTRILAATVRVQGPDGPPRDLLVRYLSAMGFGVQVGTGLSGYYEIACQDAIWTMEIGGGRSQFMVDAGALLTEIALTLAQGE